jgi:hypothetical protein
MGDNNVVATPKFFKKYLGSLKNSVVYLGTCCSGYTDDLADVFLKKGAVAVIGNSDTIRTAYNTRMMKSVAYYLGQRDSDGEYMDLASALAKAKEDWGADDSVSFGGDGATAVIFGGSDALGFRITGAAAVSSVAVAPVEEEPSVDTQALYEAFLAANTSYKYYACVDMNGDGVDELLAAQNKSDLTVTTYPSDYIMCQFADVYTIQNGTVTYAGNLGSSLDNLYYNSTNHCVESYWGGSGYSQFIFCTVDNSGNLITKYLSYSLDDDTYYYGDDVADDDIIDKSTYDEYYSMWNTDVEYIEFQQNS